MLGPDAKLDIKHAFRLCRAHSCDWPLLGYFWHNIYFIDTRLPFGSRSSPFIFNTFADALAWIFVSVFGIPWLLHYLDDFFICARSQQDCLQHIDIFQSACDELGVPLASDKTVGPASTVTYLGIEINSSHQTIKLPNDKFLELQSLLMKWYDRKKCTKRDFLSMIGSLSFACKVVKPGRICLRRLIDLSTTVTCLNHHISLNAEAREDIALY